MAKKHKIFWTDSALADLRGIEEYVSRDNPDAARKLAANLKKSVQRLSEFPLSGRCMEEFPGTQLREIIVVPYRIVYQPREQGVLVLRVWHERRLLAEPAMH